MIWCASELALLTVGREHFAHKAVVGTIDVLGRRGNARPDHLTPVHPHCTISRSATLPALIQVTSTKDARWWRIAGSAGKTIRTVAKRC